MLEGEALFSVPMAVERATGQRPHPSSCHRWRLRGVNHVRLETVRLAGRRLTSIEAVRRFINATTAAADGTEVGPSVSHTNREREASIASAGASCPRPEPDTTYSLRRELHWSKRQQQRWWFVAAIVTSFMASPLPTLRQW